MVNTGPVELSKQELRISFGETVPRFCIAAPTTFPVQRPDDSGNGIVISGEIGLKTLLALVRGSWRVGQPLIVESGYTRCRQADGEWVNVYGPRIIFKPELPINWEEGDGLGES